MKSVVKGVKRAAKLQFNVGDYVRHTEEGDQGRVYDRYRSGDGSAWVYADWKGMGFMHYPAEPLEVDSSRGRTFRPEARAI